MRLFMTREEREDMAKARAPQRDGASGPSLATTVLAAAAGAAAIYLFDPQQGRRRRAMLGDRVAAVARRGSRRFDRLTRYAGSMVSARRQRMAPEFASDAYVDDVTLTDRVESQVFRDQDLPKGELNIDSVDGVVMIRGQVERPDVINEIVARTWRVDGVRDVRNLMHLPGTPAPHID